MFGHSLVGSISIVTGICFWAGLPGHSSSIPQDHVFPEILRGDWFAWEDGSGRRVTIDQSEYGGRGQPLSWHAIGPDIRDYTFLRNDCYYCTRFVVRSWNIVERFDGPCGFHHRARRRRSSPTVADNTATLDLAHSWGKSLDKKDGSSPSSSKVMQLMKLRGKEEKERFVGSTDRYPPIDQLCGPFDLNYYRHEYVKEASNGVRLKVNVSRVDMISIPLISALKDNFTSNFKTVTLTPEFRSAGRNILDNATNHSRIPSPTVTEEGDRISSRLSVRHGVLMHRKDPVPVHCLSFITGHYKMAWRNMDSLSGECSHPSAELSSCQRVGEQFTADGQHLTVTYKRCRSVQQSFDAVIPYSCLGSWHVGSLHYLAVANLQQGDEEQRYRCFLQDLTEPQLILGVSRNPGCGGLSTPDTSPVLMTLKPVVPEHSPSCSFPRPFTGTWQDTGRGEALVTINATHLTTLSQRGARTVRVVHSCVRSRRDRYLLAAVPDNGCDVEYVCWEILSRHHNVIRYRRGRHSNVRSFETCDHRAFGSGRLWKYDTLIADPPTPVSCPIHGRFLVTQSGSAPLTPRLVGGVLSAPLDAYPCRARTPVWSVCPGGAGLGTDTILVDLDVCTDLDSRGMPSVVKEHHDYELQCVGYWQENLKSYLLTFSPSDPVSRYRCWVYQRVSVTEVRVSLAVGSACGLHQNHLSGWYNESAQLALRLQLRERIHDQCPMMVKIGKDPWADDLVHRSSSPVIFNFGSTSGADGTVDQLVPVFHASWVLALVVGATVIVRDPITITLMVFATSSAFSFY